MPTTLKKIIRMQLDFPSEQARQLDLLMREAQIADKKDLFNTALSLLAWVVNEKTKDRKILSVNVDENSYEELVMPFFRSLRGAPQQPPSEVRQGFHVINRSPDSLDLALAGVDDLTKHRFRGMP